jgi:hypothetical protein
MRSAMPGAGQYIPQATVGLSSAYGRVRKQLTGPFGQLVDMSIMAGALEAGGGNGIEGVISALDETAGAPGVAHRLLVDKAGGRGAALAFADMGLPMSIAKQLADMSLVSGGVDFGNYAPTGGRGLAAASAIKDAQLLANISVEEGNKLIAVVASLEGVMDGLGQMGSSLVSTLKDIADALSGDPGVSEDDRLKEAFRKSNKMGRAGGAEAGGSGPRTPSGGP